MFECVRAAGSMTPSQVRSLGSVQSAIKTSKSYSYSYHVTHSYTKRHIEVRTQVFFKILKLHLVVVVTPGLKNCKDMNLYGPVIVITLFSNWVTAALIQYGQHCLEQRLSNKSSSGFCCLRPDL